MWTILALTMSLALSPHGGQFQMPLETGTDEASDPPILVSQPGWGPAVPFDASRWEWWFDQFQEALLPLRALSHARAGTRPVAAVTERDRLQRVLPVLVDALRRDDAHIQRVGSHPNTRDVRAAAVMALGRLGLADAVPYLEYVVESEPDLFVRTQAVLALGISGRPEATETLVRLYEDDGESSEWRAFAAAGLGLLDDVLAVDVLARELKSSRLEKLGNQVSEAVIFAAGVSGHARLSGPLLELGESRLARNEPEVRALLCTAVGGLDDHNGLPLLLDLMEDPDSQVRRSAAAGLAALASHWTEHDGKRVAARIEREPDLPARFQLLYALGRARLDSTRAALVKQWQTGTHALRPHIALALGLDGHPDHGTRLEPELLRDVDPSLRAAVALAVAMLDHPGEAAAAVGNLLGERTDPHLSGYAALAAGWLGLTDTSERIEQLARSTHDPEVVRLAMLGLGVLGDRQRLDGLAADVADVPGLLDRAAQVHGLGLVGDQATLSPLLDIVADESQPAYVRAYAIDAIGTICDRRPSPSGARLARAAQWHLDVSVLIELGRMP